MPRESGAPSNPAIKFKQASHKTEPADYWVARLRDR